MHLELHRHGKYSILDGAGEAESWAKRAAELEMPALVITDHGTLTGVLDHVSSCRKHGIWPLIGIEAYYRDNRLLKVKENSKAYHMTLLAMNERGWRSLVRLSSESFQSGFYGRPCVDPEILARHSEDVYCLAGCIGGRFASHVIAGHEGEVATFVGVLRSIFGDNLSLEIMPHDFNEQRQLNIDTWRVSYEHSIPMVVTGDAHYPTIDWYPTQDIRLMAATSQTNLKRKAKEAKGEDIYTMVQENPTLFLMSEQEKRDAFAEYHPNMDSRVVDAALAHSGEIVSKFVPFLFDRDVKMPRVTHRVLSKVDDTWPYPGTDSTLYEEEWWIEQDDAEVRATLLRWVHEGLEKIKTLYPEEHWQKFSFQSYVDQIDHEMAVFDGIGPHVVRYLVIAAGEVRWARENDIAVGPGRGSAAGSIVCYLAGLTEVDPISYGMIFERFINPGRKGMPDIDIDFMPGDRGRDKVKAHTAEVYGIENVFDVAAYGSYGPRSAIRAVVRIHDDEVGYEVAELCMKELDSLDSTDKPDLAECAERFPAITRFRDQYPKLWQHALRLEHHPYSFSRHASAVLVKPSSIEIPLATRANKDTGDRELVSAWPDTHELLANYGFLKLDYLVIDGLIRQHEIVKALRERENTPIDLAALPVRWDPYATDPEVMEMFGRGLTDGVWQMSGKSTIPVLKAVKPDSILDLAAINAIIRPGPRGAGMVESYARRKHGEEPITYWHDSLEPILNWTYGLLIYQENVMQVAMTLADYTGQQADDLRKAMGKKYREGLAVVKKFLRDEGHYERFIQGAATKIGEEAATVVWDKILAFGGYSFALPHASAYSLISYHDMLLKVKAPADFYAWLLTYTDTADMAERVGSVMREGKRFGVSVKPPSINHSDLGFSVVDKETIVYGLESVKGCGPVAAKAIFESRPYRSYQDFESRVAKKSANKKVKEALIAAGAFDDFAMRDGMTDVEKADAEQDVLGVRLSGKSDLDAYSDLIEDTIHTEYEFDDAADGEFMCVGGEITAVKTTRTKAKQEEMGFVSVAYGSDSYRVTVFPGIWTMENSKFVVGDVVFFEGTKQIDQKYGDSFIAKGCITLAELMRMRGVEPVVGDERPVSINPFLVAV